MSRTHQREKRVQGQTHRRHELERIYRPPVRDGLSRFETFEIRPEALAGVPAERERPAAVARARELAQGAGFAIVDVVRADYQDGGAWRVELVVVPNK
jgi:hypothetical protein